MHPDFGFSQSLCPRYDYLFYILQKYRVRQDFTEHLHAMYSDATASVQINDTIASPYRPNVVCGKVACWAWPSMGYTCALSSARWPAVYRAKRRMEEEIPTHSGVFWWFHPHSGTRNHTSGNTMLWKSYGSTNQSFQIESHGPWRLDSTSDRIRKISFHDIHYFGNKVLGVIFGPTIPHTMKYSETGFIHLVRKQTRKAYTRRLFYSASPLRTIAPTC